MKDMFYKYDRQISEGYPRFKVPERPKEAESEFGAKLIKNLKNDVLGVQASKDLEFRLYFYLSDLGSDVELPELLNNSVFTLNIFGPEGVLIASFAGEKYSDDCVSVDVDSKSLNAGLYRLQLVLAYEEKEYIIFSPEAGVLSII